MVYEVVKVRSRRNSSHLEDWKSGFVASDSGLIENFFADAKRPAEMLQPGILVCAFAISSVSFSMSQSPASPSVLPF
jgi:hypothetical protein